MKVTVIIASTFLLLLCNWVHAVDPIYLGEIGFSKLIDYNHFQKSNSNSNNQIINLIEDLSVDPEEDCNNSNDLKTNKETKHLNKDFNFLPAQKASNLFKHQVDISNTLKYYSTLFEYANPIYILNSNLRI